MNQPLLNQSQWQAQLYWRYGSFGACLSLIGIPIYMYLPTLYHAAQPALSLGVIGIILLVTRCTDALIDPFLGRWLDQQNRDIPSPRHQQRQQRLYAGFITLMLLGFVALLAPPLSATQGVELWMAWLTVMLTVTYLGYSLVSIAYQSALNQLTDQPATQMKLTAYREGFGLMGLICAALIPTLFNMNALITTTCLIGIISGVAWLSLSHQQPNIATPSQVTPLHAIQHMHIDDSAISQLLRIMGLNALANAIPTQLMLFYVHDILGGSEPGYFLLIYCLAGALSLPLWQHLARRYGVVRAWRWGVGLAIATFSLTLLVGISPTFNALLPATAQFGMVCAISGLALGADLAFPTLLLTRLIAAQTANQIAIHNQQQAGYWFGRWNQYAKLALALAAGVCLPALNWAGYQPQQHNTSFTLGLLVGLYAALPCLIKLIVLRQLNRHTLLWSHFNAT